MHLDDVRSALKDKAATVPPARTPSDAVLAQVHRRVHRRRVLRAVAVAAAVVAVSAGVVAAVVGRSSSGHRLVVAGPATTTGPVRGFTAEQMRAHDGVDVPAGWVPVDTGDARVFVPPDWIVEPPGYCYSGAAFPGMVMLGHLPEDCARAPWPVPAEAMALTRSETAPNVRPAVTVHGYRAYLAAGSVGRISYDIPRLHVRITLQGTLGPRVLDTLAPSARAIALATAGSTRASAGRPVATDGISMVVPASWPVVTPATAPCYLTGPYSPGRPEVVRMNPDAEIPPCPMQLRTAADEVRDGVYLYTAGYASVSRPGGPAIAVLHHGPTTIRVYDDLEPSTLELEVQRRGSQEVHVLRLGLGTNGRVAGSVLASMRATS